MKDLKNLRASTEAEHFMYKGYWKVQRIQRYSSDWSVIKNTFSIDERSKKLAGKYRSRTFYV